MPPFDLSRIPPIEHLDRTVDVQRAFDAWRVPVSHAAVCDLLERLELVVRPELKEGGPDPENLVFFAAFGSNTGLMWTTDMARYFHQGVTTTTYGVLDDGDARYYVCARANPKNKRTILTLSAEQHAWVKSQSSGLKSMAAVIRDLIDRERLGRVRS